VVRVRHAVDGRLPMEHFAPRRAVCMMS
jgi:hypothetical protein